jgi:hypothetical protein
MTQIKLFDEDDFWQKEWREMPEFIMTPEVPVLTIKLNFKTKEDIKKFSEIFGQEIKFTQENYWFPKLNRCAISDLKYYGDES